MKLVLLRHADAEPDTGGPLGDPGRALTSLGREQARDSARALSLLAPMGSRQIWTSPLVRAVQTAEILAHHWADAQVAVADALATGRPVAAQLQLVEELPARDATALVGHEPLMAELAAALLGLPVFPLPFEKGAALILRRLGDRFEFEAFRAPYREAITAFP